MTVSPRKSVGIIGAGVSGVVAAIHAKAAGLEVTIFERSSNFGGVWVFDKNLPPEPPYPAETPSESDFTAINTQEEWKKIVPDYPETDAQIWHSPPGPCYEQLSNNVPTHLMELQSNSWKPDTAPIVNHSVLKDYIQDTASKYHLAETTIFDTRVDRLEKVDGKWRVDSSTLLQQASGELEVVPRQWEFDNIVVATGHYHACRIPAIPGLRTWKTRFPSSIQHSKSYRSAKLYRNKTVLLVGASVSSTDIAKELGSTAKKVYQTSRQGIFDLPVSMLPENASRVADVAEFSSLDNEREGQNGRHGNMKLDDRSSNGGALGTVILKDGTHLHDIDHIILCTGYHMTFPFLPHLHSNTTAPSLCPPEILVTDGTQTHNLHTDIFYIPDPTLAFIGVPYHVATFSLFEYQAIAIAAAFSGQAKLPSEEEMRRGYEERLREKGAGKAFHSLKMWRDEGGVLRDPEVEYVDGIVKWVNEGAGKVVVTGHSEEWILGKRKLMEGRI